MAPVVVFLHSGQYDKLHQGAAIAAAAAASGRSVELFFFWWALEKLALGGLAEPAFDAVGPSSPEAAEELTHRFEQRGYPTAQALLEAARSSGHCRVFACSASLEILGLRPAQVETQVDSILGWSAILARTEGAPDRFYL
ncbi:MAG: hypothetical protein ACYCWW_11070 [Deltaproteobacteria bacterium]